MDKDFLPWLGGTGALLGMVATYIFGKQKHARQASDDKLNDANNSVSANFVSALDRQYDKAIAQRDEAMQQARVNLDMFLAEKLRNSELTIELMEMKSEMKTMQAQMRELTGKTEVVARVVMRKHPEEAGEIDDSVFGEFR